MTMLNIVGHTTIAGGSVQVGPEFSPASLFAASEVGVWYDPSDFSTLFQNTNGTSPVTAVEQPVGLMLDKSQGLTLGSELVTNGDFSNGTTGWALTGGTAAVSSGVVTLTNVSSRAVLSQTFTTVVGQRYRVTFSSIVNGAGSTAYVRVTSNNSFGGTVLLQADATNSNGFLVFTATTTTSYLWLANNVTTAGLTIEFGPVSIKLDPGNHAKAANNSTARPVLRSRYNLLTYSEQFDNAAWPKASATITADATTAPDGTTTADTITTTSPGGYIISPSISGPVSTPYKSSCYFKSDGTTGSDYAILYIGGGGASGNDAGATVNLSTLDIVKFGVTSSSITVTASQENNGWIRVNIFSTTGPSDGIFEIIVGFSNVSGGASSVNVSGYAWGAQVVANSVFPQNTYQRIAAATDYDTDATKFPPYLAFTTDDVMSTASINFSGTDEMTVFAGVTKNSDADSGILVELSAIAENNNGTFVVLAPSFEGANSYRYASKGTGIVVAGTGTFAPAPDTAVITGLSDISGDTVTLRRNGSVVETSTADQGTGNYGNYPLYIGARGGSSLFFNGSLYSLIVRGKTSTFDEIRTTELWIAQKVGL